MKFLRFGNSLINVKHIKYVNMDLTKHNLITLRVSTTNNEEKKFFGSNDTEYFEKIFTPHKHKNYVLEAEEAFNSIEKSLRDNVIE